MANLPVQLNVPNQLVYEAHDYGFWYSGGVTSYSNYVNTITPKWGYLITGSNPQPLWVGEFGTCNSGNICVSSSNSVDLGYWFQAMSTFVEQYGLDWSYWAINGTTESGNGGGFNTIEGYGVLNTSWNGSALPALTSRLQSMMSSAAPNITLIGNGTALPIVHGGTAVATVAIVPGNGFTGTVNPDLLSKFTIGCDRCAHLQRAGVRKHHGKYHGECIGHGSDNGDRSIESYSGRQLAGDRLAQGRQRNSGLCVALRWQSSSTTQEPADASHGDLLDLFAHSMRRGRGKWNDRHNGWNDSGRLYSFCHRKRHRNKFGNDTVRAHSAIACLGLQHLAHAQDDDGFVIEAVLAALKASNIGKNSLGDFARG